MSTIANSITVSQTIPQALTETGAECPLHSAMREMAGLAVTQHVLYLEGECLPRPDLTRRLEAWSRVHALLSTRLCAATRTTPLDREEIVATLDQIRTPVEDMAESGAKDQFAQDLEKTLTQCLACARSCACPLGDPGARPFELSSRLPCPIHLCSMKGACAHMPKPLEREPARGI